MNSFSTHKFGALLASNPYPGRGIAAGLSESGKYAVAVYFIMGRSDNSRNRVFTKTDGGITIYPFDESKVGDPSLIIYSPVRALSKKLIVTNGDQTDTVYDALKSGSTFEGALESRTFEPDAPNYTPRISALLDFTGGYTYRMSILKSFDGSGTACVRCSYAYEPVRGLGHFIHTYMGDGAPLPSFTGDPEAVSVPDDMEGFCDEVWQSLNGDNKISLYVRYTNIRTGESVEKIINKNKKARC